jgi:exopolysaccharide biosynthesis polyprenyl glycosylphosphotransferase
MDLQRESITRANKQRTDIQSTNLRANSPFEARWLMPFVDVVLAFAAFGLAYYVRYDLQFLRPVYENNVAQFNPYIPYVFVFSAWLLINYRGAGLYRNIRGRSWLAEVGIVINGAANATLITMALSFLFQPAVFSRLMLVYVAGFTVLLLAITRVLRRMMRAHLRTRGIGVQRVLLVGAGDVGQAVLRIMLARKELGYYPVGYVDDDPNLGKTDIGRVRGLGDITKMKDVIRKQNVNMVVITLKWAEHERIVKLVRACRKLDVEVRVVPDVFQLNMKQVQVENLDGIPLLGVNSLVEFQQSNRLLKRLMDLTLITLLLPLWLPLFALTALAIRLESKGPVFYTARRIGEKGRPFGMIKFRSMVPDADKLRQHLIDTHELDPRHPKIPDDPRITRVGHFIRRTSLDELPNLVNVIRGEMSLVGPRPPTPDEVTLYETWHRQRLQIMPGISGLWQISGRSDVPFEEMCLLDIYYIENWSLILDIQILLMTPGRVLMRSGAY